jgi:lipid-A-disaccharide synthase|tara:strand:- start:579 stop:1781 length:1203 start_codon:yes stop_codon:yes gene_type:complete
MIEKPIKFFIIAGESSGDIIGGKLIAEIKEHFSKNNQPEFIGIGGANMQEQGLESIFPMSDLNIMGFFEIIPHIPKILFRINQTINKILYEKPDYLITIDSPDFSFRVLDKLLKKIKNNPKFTNNFAKLKKTHIIAPSVWAYRKKRAQKIAKLYNLLLAILPFEPPYFEKYGLKTIFIGNPIIEKIPNYTKKSELRLKFQSQNNIKKNDFVILMTPGSRISEVKRIMPEFINALNLMYQENTNIMSVILVTDKTRKVASQLAKKLQCNYSLISSTDKDIALFSADFALAKSGTNTIELALYKIPMIIAYKVNILTYLILKPLIKVKYVNILNLILNKKIITELIQENCNAKLIFEELRHLMLNKEVCERQISDSEFALDILGLNSAKSPSNKAAAEILKL